MDRQDFMDIVYAELTDDPDNNRANRIIEAADEYAESTQLGTNLAEVGTDCISRQALLDKFEPWLKVKDYNDGELNMLKAVLYEIRFMRPAQPELKKGKWIRSGWAVTCSECGYDMPYTVRRFCPNCGAKMTKGDAE